MQGTRLHLSNTSVCRTNAASSNCGAPEGTEYVQNYALSKQVILVYLNISTFIIYCTCCEGLCIHWASTEYSTSTEPSLIDGEGVVYAFLESTKCVLLTICLQTALINVSPTCSPVVDVVLLCVAGSHPCQTYRGRRQHSC